MINPSLRYVCRSCQRTLGRQRPDAARTNSTRNFSSSREYQKSLATFNPTKSPELDTLLTTWRNKVFLPTVVSDHHQKLIFKTKHSDLLENDPGVSATVETSRPPRSEGIDLPIEETIRLRHKLPHDQPPRKESLNTILTVLKVILLPRHGIT